MQDLRREILTQVATGKISAEEGAARLEALEANTPAGAPATSATTAPAPPPTALTAVPNRKVRVVTNFGGAEIIGDPSVAYAVPDGAHSVRQEGDTMVIEQSSPDHDSFSVERGGARGAGAGMRGLDWIGWRQLTVRMNPDIPLEVQIQAGSVRVDGVHGPISGDIQAGNCRVTGFRGPLNLSLQAGNVNASGRLDGGSSKVQCEMGSIRIGLDSRSSVKITARTSLGKIAVEGEGGVLGTGGKDVTIGSGAGTLDLECSMGSVRVAVE
ncbi:MAG TPA: hypothetical protein VJT78_13445 [Candidatus Dormibacteraeota bacterium]|nr:hypothetical protein [Candidatus Dormibacteraeota bacterium]